MKKYMIVLLTAVALSTGAQERTRHFTVTPVQQGAQPTLAEKGLVFMARPGSERLSVQYLLPGAVKASIQLLDEQGNLVQEVLLHPDLSRASIDFSRLGSGVYQYRYLISDAEAGKGVIEVAE